MNTKRNPDPADIHIGQRVRLRRMMLGMSQQALGEACGHITFQQIQKYEKGTNRIGGSRMAQIATVLKVPVSFFYEDMPGAAGLVAVGELHRDAADPSRLLDYLKTKEGIRLNQAFAKIGSVRLRLKLVGLAEAMAGVDSPDEVAA